MKKFLILQATYDAIELGLYQGTEELESESVNKMQASSLLMSIICTLLKKHALTFNHLSFIGASLGPAPFTTLRTLIATINGIGFATKTPLIGSDGLEVCVKNYHTSDITVGLFNAFSGDSYYGFYDGKNYNSGSQNTEKYITTLAQKFPNTKIHFIGNGVSLVQETIKKLFKDNAIIKEEAPVIACLSDIAKICSEEYQKNNEGKAQLVPLHIKTMNYKKTT